MKHMRKYADYAQYFADTAYVSQRVEAIMAKAAVQPNGCIELPPSARGYAQVYFGGRMWQAHRLLWMIEHGDIGSLVVDHKCRNRACINLAHVEPVTNAENVRRGDSFSPDGRCAKGHRLAHCRRGRYCPTCRNEAYRRRYTDPDYAAAQRARKNRNYHAAR